MKTIDRKEETRRNKLQSIQEANEVATRRWQFTLTQFFASTFTLAIIWNSFQRPFLSLALAVTVAHMLEMLRKASHWKAWAALSIAWALTLLESKTFLLWVKSIAD